ncbi:MAG: hypothetical protein M3N32_00690 [Actinomycetota bacterium]|nr:hypothetical protein [Actinomycetota bacterium]
MSRRAGVVLGVVLAILAGALVANAVLTSVVERRLSARFSEGIGKPAIVDLQGWPAALRLLVGGVPRVEVASDGGPVGETPIRTLQASLFDVDVDGRTLLDGGPPIRLTAAHAHLDVGFRADRAPLGVSSLELSLRNITSRLGRGVSGNLLTSRDAEMMVSDIAFPNSPARLSRLHATFPELRLTKPAPTADTVVVESPDARFEALLTEAAANTLWTLPGQVKFLEDVARLTVGPFSLDVQLRVAGDRVVLEPQVPPLLRPVIRALPPVSFRPDLPLGAVIEEVQLQAGTMILQGSSQQLQVPLQPQPANAA